MRAGWKNKQEIWGMLAGKNSMDSGCFSRRTGLDLNSHFKDQNSRAVPIVLKTGGYKVNWHMKCIKQRLRGQTAASNSSTAGFRLPWRAKPHWKKVGKPWWTARDTAGGLMSSHLTQHTTFTPYVAKPEVGAGAACLFYWKGRLWRGGSHG